MEATVQKGASKYVKTKQGRNAMRGISILFFFTMFVMPQYFGLPFPVFDLTMLRIMLLVVLLIIFTDRQRKDEFAHLIIEEKCGKFLLPYLFVLVYTMVLRADPNALLNPLLEIVGFYVLLYVIKHEIGVEDTVHLIIIFMFIMTFLGVIEFCMKRTPFSYLETIKGTYTGAFVRSGNYRIMSSCVHSLGYGLLLVCMAPFACYNEKNKSVEMLAHPILLILVTANVFLCGSRSTLSVFVVEMLILVLLSTNIQKKRLILIGSVIMIVFCVWLLIFRNTSIGRYILLQITSILDELLGTEWAIQYGADPSALGSSSNYRAQLKYIFKVDWLNPLLGLGRKRGFSSEINGSFIKSVDDFYIAEFVRYAYPGLIAFVLYLGYFITGIVKRMKNDKSGLIRILFVSAGGYMLNLKWVDSLQTLKYLYTIFAIFICMEPIKQNRNKDFQLRKKSKYIKEKTG